MFKPNQSSPNHLSISRSKFVINPKASLFLHNVIAILNTSLCVLLFTKNLSTITKKSSFPHKKVSGVFKLSVNVALPAFRCFSLSGFH